MSTWIASNNEVPEIPLRSSPLAVVLFQVRFASSVVRLERSLERGDFQELIADQYPYQQEQKRPDIVITPDGVTQTETVVRALISADQHWTVAAANDSISLTTDRYSSRADFLVRANSLLEAVTQVARPPGYARLGVRYINRVENILENLEWIRKLAPGAQGPIHELTELDRRNVIESQVSIQLPGTPSQSSIRARWGIIPPNAQVNPPLAPTSDASWVLDIDSFIEGPAPLEWRDVDKTLKTLTEDAYRIFRSIVSNQALERFDPKW